MAEQMRALRGATTLDLDDAVHLIERTSKLIKEMLARNDLTSANLVSIIFTATGDIHSEFPAAAARSIGISDVPLLGAREIDVEGAVPLCIRVLMHAYTEREPSSLRHVYLERARPLRHDLPE